MFIGDSDIFEAKFCYDSSEKQSAKLFSFFTECRILSESIVIPVNELTRRWNDFIKEKGVGKIQLEGALLSELKICTLEFIAALEDQYYAHIKAVFTSEALFIHEIADFIMLLLERKNFVFKNGIFLRGVTAVLRGAMISYYRYICKKSGISGAEDEDELFVLLFDSDEPIRQKMAAELFLFVKSFFEPDSFEMGSDIFFIREYFVSSLCEQFCVEKIMNKSGNLSEGMKELYYCFELEKFDTETVKFSNMRSVLVSGGEHCLELRFSLAQYESEDGLYENAFIFSCSCGKKMESLPGFEKKAVFTTENFQWHMAEKPVQYYGNKKYIFDESMSVSENTACIRCAGSEELAAFLNRYNFEKVIVLHNAFSLFFGKPYICCRFTSDAGILAEIYVHNSLIKSPNRTKKPLCRAGKKLYLSVQMQHAVHILKKIYKLAEQGMNAGFLSALREISIKENIRIVFDSKTMMKSVRLPRIETRYSFLREYQKKGIRWLYMLKHYGFGGILADDMGLGKTLQVLIYLGSIKKHSPAASFLIISPASVMYEWENENKKFNLLLETIIYHGAQRKKTNFKGKTVLTTYHTLKNSPELLEQVWDVAVADEAQMIKNPFTAVSKACRKIHALQKLSVTGTPVENQVQDLWTVMDFANHGLLGSRHDFIAASEHAAEKIRMFCEPFILKRVKEDPKIGENLPDKIEYTHYCELTDEQKRLYTKVIDNYRKQARKSAMNRMRMLEVILRCKQICNHPAQYTKDSRSLSGRSAKLDALTFICGKYMESRNKILIFSQFLESCKILRTVLAYSFGAEKIFFMSSEQTMAQRKKLVKDFTAAPSPAIFILTLGTGGFGLNLQAANVVIHFDRWWNPAREEQSTDRAYRLGQLQNVHVHRFITRNSVEENIHLIQERKRALYNELIQIDAAGEDKFTKKELEEIIDGLSHSA